MLVQYAASFLQDIEALSDWIAQDNPGRAITFVDEILDVCANIVSLFPERGRRRPEFGRNTRSYVTHQRTIYYDFYPNRQMIRFRRLIGPQQVERSSL